MWYNYTVRQQERRLYHHEARIFGRYLIMPIPQAGDFVKSLVNGEGLFTKNKLYKVIRFDEKDTSCYVVCDTGSDAWIFQNEYRLTNPIIEFKKNMKKLQEIKI